MKKIIVLLLFLSCIEVLNAQQSLLPKFNARWDYQFTYLISPPGQGIPAVYRTIHSTYLNQGDTMVNGKVNYQLSPNLFFIEDSNRVFLGALNSKKLFMDFNLNVNDTFNLYVNSYVCAAGVVLYSVNTKDSVLMGGRWRQRVTLTSNSSCRPSKALRWVEGLGDINHGGIREDYTADCIITNNTQLNCFFDNGITVYSNNNCAVTNIMESEIERFQLYPNPVQNELKVKGHFIQLEYQIFSIEGKLVQTGTLLNDEQINLEQLEMGVYTISLNDGINFYREKFIKN
tara:strand:+ start:2202 stop:3062 length:861 start_codon:yes stop_codon:yes gene_type:complete